VTLRYQTPELLLVATHFFLPVPIWSVGCIFVFGLRNLHSSSSLMEGDKREDVEDQHREFTEDEMNGKVAQSETSTSSVLDLAFEQSSRQPFTALSQEDSDLALARALQEQEMAYMLLRRNAESSDYETSGSGNYDHEYYIDDRGENEDEVDANADDFEREALADGDHEEVDASLFESDEAYARALQEAEDRLLTAQMMALAGINDREEDDNEDNDSTSRDAWQDVDPDNMLYEELVALSEVVGTESRGLAPDLISSLPLSKFVPETPSSSNSERCVICRLEYEGGDIILTLPCKHQYHSDCIKNWLQIKKVCPVCNVEVSDRTNH